MRVATIPVFKFDELTPIAKEIARGWWRDGWDYPWNEESRGSIETFCKHFGVTLKDWQVGPYWPFSYSTDAGNANFRGLKLRDVEKEAMPTDFCLDNSLWYAFYDEFKRSGDAKGAFNVALDAGFRAWSDDMEDQLSDEAVDENITCNDIEFTKDGQPYRA